MISTQTGWRGLEAPLLEAPLWVAEDPARNAPPAAHFDAYGVTGYFGHQLGNEKAPEVCAGSPKSRAAAEREAEPERPVRAGARGRRGRAPLRRAIATRRRRAARRLADRPPTTTSIAALVDELLALSGRGRARHGLDLVMYEGGTHVVGGPTWRDNPELTEFFAHLNYSPGDGRALHELLDGWRSLGRRALQRLCRRGRRRAPTGAGARCGISTTPTRAGTRSTGSTAKPPPGGRSGRPAPSTTASCCAARGGGRSRGTAYTDALIGGAGDDLLIGGGGADRLHGGEGRDTALLPGSAADYTLARTDGAIVASGPGGATRLVAIETVRFSADDAASITTGDLE